jgi:hypothetical protein
MVRGGRAEAPAPRSDVSFRLHQKTGNFKAAIDSRVMQWSVLTEERQKNEIAQREFSFIKRRIIISAVAITGSPSPPHQRCTAAKDGQLQDCQTEQTNAVGCID